MGSSPIAGTILFCWLPVLSGGVAKWLNAVDCNSILSEFGGSNPPPPTILLKVIGVSPSGKAPDFDSGIPLVRIQVPQPLYVTR